MGLAIAPPRRAPKPPRPVVACGVCGVAVPYYRRYCSRAHAKEFAFAASFARQWYPGGKPREASARKCVSCAIEFRPRNYKTVPPIACSPACAREHRRETARRHSRIGKAVRRARKRQVPAEPIDPIAIFERDGWLCGICGGPTLKGLRGTTHDDAPELDHVIPLSKGGHHTKANVQCAHRRCNNAKGARVAA